MKCIGDILAYMRLIPKKVTKLKGKLLQYFIHLQAQIHSHGEVSHPLFLKLKQLFFFSKLKVEKMPLNTLVNCIMQSLFFIDTIFKMSKSFCFLILSERFLLLSKTPACMRDLIIPTLKLMQVKSYGKNILKVKTFCLTWKFIQNLAKKISVTHVYSDIWEMKECLIQKYFLLIKRYWSINHIFEKYS